MHRSLLVLVLPPALALGGPSLADRVGPFDGPLGSKRIGAHSPCIGAYAKRFTADGRTLISLDELNILRVCDLDSGRLVSSHVLHLPVEDNARDELFSPTNARLAVSDDDSSVAVLWRSFSEPLAHVVVFRVSDGKTDWQSSYAFETDRVTQPYHNITFSENGTELWVVSTDSRSPLVRLSTPSGEVLGRVDGVGVGPIYGRPNWDHDLPGNKRVVHPFDVGPRPVGDVLWTSGGLGDEHTAASNTVDVSTGTLRPLNRDATPALSTGGAELHWGRASGGSGALSLVRGKRPPTEIALTLPDSVKSVVRGRAKTLSTLLWSRDGQSLSVSMADASLELDMAKGKVIGRWSPKLDGAERVLAPPGGPLGLAWMPEAYGLYRVDVFDREGEVLRSVRDSGRVRPVGVQFLPDDSGILVQMPGHLEIYSLSNGGASARVQPQLTDGQTFGRVVGL
ncbi:MAG: hypothetical protein ACI9MC_002833, partial [Kiritimatiellia bacterium]